MKKITFSIGFLVVMTFNVCAQNVLTYNKNAYLVGDDQPFILANHVSEGDSGHNQIWDYSLLTQTGNLTSYMYAAANFQMSILYPEANILLREDDNDYYFKVTQSGMEEYGYSNGNKTMVYDNPIVKFPFPFSYGSSYTGTYYGRVVNPADSTLSTFSGTYSTIADGYGTLILPGNIEIKHVLRVRFTRKPDNSTGENITYRWYVKNSNPIVRYPLLTIQTSKVDGISNVYRVAYYANAYQFSHNQDKSIQIQDNDEYTSLNDSVYNIKISPNPFVEQANIEYYISEDAKINIQVFDNLGKLVENLIDVKQNPGKHSLTFKGNGQFIYFIRFIINDKLICSKKIIQLK